MRKVEVNIEIAATPETVIRAFTDPEGNYTYLNPERPILGGLSLLVEARPSDKGSSVYLCQDGYSDSGHDPHWDWYYEVVEDAWPKVMLTFKSYLEKMSRYGH